MRNVTRLVLYAFVGMCVATAHVDLLAGLACWLLIELVFRQQESTYMGVRQLPQPSKPLTDDPKAKQAKLADLARQSAKRAADQAALMVKMRES